MSDDAPFPAERAEVVLSLLQVQGRVTSSDLAVRFGVSEDSIRRDLRELATQGLCKRVHGGAVRVQGPQASFEQRVEHVPSSKAALALAVSCLFERGEVVFLDAGTTNLAVARCMPEDMALTVITNSPQIAIAAGERAGLRVQLIGGTFSSSAGAVVGAEALLQLERLRVDTCVPGACAVDPQTGVWATDPDEAAFKRLIVRNSARVIVAPTAAKLGMHAHYQVASLTDIDILVVERGVPPAQLLAFSHAGIDVRQPAP